MNLNEQQKKIVNTAPGKIAVIASAGSGKTSTTLCLIEKKYIDDGVSLEKMWISTFTNKAARDLKSKLKLKLGLSDIYLNKLWVGTFHSLGFRYLILGFSCALRKVAANELVTRRLSTPETGITRRKAG